MNFRSFHLRIWDWLTGASYNSPSASAIYSAAFDVANHDCNETRSRLYQTMLQSIFIIPKLDHPKLEPVRPIANSPFPLTTVGTGRKGLPIFTSTGALRIWLPTGCGYVLMQGQNFFLMALSQGAEAISLNPESLPSGIIENWELRRLAEGLIPATDSSQKLRDKLSGDIRFRPLEKSLPSLFLTEVCEILKSRNEVDRAYAFEVSINGAPSRNAIAVSCPGLVTEEKPDEFMPLIAKISSKHNLDMYFLVLQHHPALSSIPNTIDSFYQRGDPEN